MSRYQICRRFSATSSQIQAYRTKGWCAVENIFSEQEAVALRGALINLVQGGNLANVSTDGDGVTHSEVARSLQLCPLSPHAPILKLLPFHPKVAEVIHQLLCDSPEESACCYLSQTFWKPAKSGEGTSWHQDNSYFEVPKANKGCGMWIPVHDACFENGTFQVCDSTTEILPHKRELNSDHHITCKDEINEDFNQHIVPMNAGGAIFFDFNAPHRTSANITDNPRAAIAFHFLNMKEFKFRAFPLPEDAEYVTPVICGPENSYGAKEYGQIVWDSNEWSKQVEINQKWGHLKAQESYTTVKQDMVKQDMSYNN